MVIRANRNVLHFDVISHVIFSHKYNLNISNNKNNSHSKENPDCQSTQNEGYSYVFLSEGALTVEAAFGVLLFFTMVFALLSLFWSMEEVEQVQLHMAGAVKQYACFGTKLGTAEVVWKDNAILCWDEENNICYTDRTRPIPFLGSAFFRLYLYQQMKVSNYSGRSMLPERTEQKRYVYLADNGTVYHVDRQCVYLKPDIESVLYREVEVKRNHSGEKYKKCEKCCGEGEGGWGRVYITPYGNRIHVNRNCSGLKRNIRRVLQEKIGNMSGCSKCVTQYEGE